jgi:AraC-like DNA-binding protein
MNKARGFAVDPGWKIMLQGIGIDAAEVLRRAGLPGDLFARKDASLSPEEYCRFWDAIEATSENQCFALELMSQMSTEVFDPVLFAAFCSPDMNTALGRIQQFKPLIGPLRLDVSITRQHTSVIIDFSGIESPVPRSLILGELAFFVQFARLATREKIVPMAVTSTVDLPAKNLISGFFGLTPTRSKKVSVRFSSTDATKPFVSENPRMWDFFEPGMKERLAELDSGASTAERIRSVLLESLPSGKSAVADTARRLAMSTRTLQRRLTAEGTSYQEVLDGVREELAMHYLKNSSLPSAQISFLLGFKDPNSFFRAFHAWSGMTPDSVRNRLVH